LASSSRAVQRARTHFADGGGYTTQFILFSAGTPDPVSGSIRFFSQSGQSMDLQLK